MIAQFWYKLIIAGVKTIDDVPAKWRAAVQEMLDEDEE